MLHSWLRLTGSQQGQTSLPGCRKAQDKDPYSLQCKPLPGGRLAACITSCICRADDTQLHSYIWVSSYHQTTACLSDIVI